MILLSEVIGDIVNADTPSTRTMIFGYVIFIGFILLLVLLALSVVYLIVSFILWLKIRKMEKKGVLKIEIETEEDGEIIR